MVSAKGKVIKIFVQAFGRAIWKGNFQALEGYYLIGTSRNGCFYLN